MPKGFKGFQKGNKLSTLKKGKSLFAGRKHSEYTKEKLKNLNLGNTRTLGKHWKLSQETKEKMSFSKRGNKSPNWKGGMTKLNMSIRACFKYRQWRSDVFTRDKFQCQDCGSKKSGNFEAHHIVPFSKILEKYCIKVIEKALLCEELWNINNGITLCISCHKKTDSYGKK